MLKFPTSIGIEFGCKTRPAYVQLYICAMPDSPCIITSACSPCSPYHVGHQAVAGIDLKLDKKENEGSCMLLGRCCVLKISITLCTQEHPHPHPWLQLCDFNLQDMNRPSQCCNCVWLCRYLCEQARHIWMGVFLTSVCVCVRERSYRR